MITALLLLNLAAALWFVARGVDRFDEKARGAPWTFRLTILPAAFVLWPLLWRKLR